MERTRHLGHGVGVRHDEPMVVRNLLLQIGSNCLLFFGYGEDFALPLRKVGTSGIVTSSGYHSSASLRSPKLILIKY